MTTALPRGAVCSRSGEGWQLVSRRYDPQMNTVAQWQRSFDLWTESLLGWLRGAGRAVFFSALVFVLLLSPSSYSRPYRPHLATHLYQGTAPIIGWYLLISAVVCVVLTGIVHATALSHGLSQYTLELLIRLLVLELMPVSAAIYVALRCTLPFGEQVEHLRDPSLQELRREVLPRVLAGMFAMITILALSSVVLLLVIYLASQGFSDAEVQSYNRLIGQVFNPSTSLIFSLKALALSVVVALVPMLSNRFGAPSVTGTPAAAQRKTSEELQEMVRMFALILAIEIVSLIASYF